MSQFKVGDRVVFEHWLDHGFVIGTLITYEGNGDRARVKPDNIIENIDTYTMDSSITLIPEDVYNSPLYKALS